MVIAANLLLLLEPQVKWCQASLANSIMRSLTLLAPGLLAASMACSAPTDPSVWRFRTVRPWLAGNSQALTPVVDRQSAFFCGGYFWDDDAAIHGLSVADGRLLWTHRVGTCRSGPWLLANMLVVHSQQSRNEPCVFQGFDPATGTVRWRREFRSDRSVLLSCTIHQAVVGDSIVFAFIGDQYVHALRTADGAVEQFALPVEPRSQRIWLTASGLDAWFGFGTRAWRWPADRLQPEEGVTLSEDVGPTEHAAASGTRLFLGGGTPAHLRAFDLTTGQRLWERTALPRILSMSADGEGLYLNIWRKRFELIAVDMKTGSERWTAAIGGFEPPTTKDGWLYANGEFSVFVADPATGTVARTIKTQAEVTTTPVLAGDLLLFGTIDGGLHAVRVGSMRR
jgi:outer membrane protein assembly factor BamB